MNSKTFSILAVVLASMSPLSRAAVEKSRAEAEAILAESNVKGGLVCHLGCGDGSITLALRANDSFQVHGLSRIPKEVEQARKAVVSADLYGSVSIEHLRGDHLPYVANLVNLLVATGGAAEGIDDDEILRVLTPRGVAIIEAKDGTRRKLTKEVPSGIDDWTHYFHNAGGNPVARDEVVGNPKHLQWIGSPRWSRHHDRMASMSAMVSGGGRIFYIMDEGSRVSIQLPGKWSLIARDAFNGVILWKVPIPKWHNHLWPLKSGPTQLARRLVTDGERVYATPGIKAPVTCYDAATGKELRVYERSEGTEELIVAGDLLVAMINEDESELDDFKPEINTGDQGRVAKQYRWNEKPRTLVAYNSLNGEELWRKQTKVSPLTVSCDGARVFYHDGEKVVSLDRATGKESWSSEQLGRRSVYTFNFGPRLLVYQDVVIFAGGDRKMHAFGAEDGKPLWESDHARGGYQSPEDLLVSGGLVWSAPTTSGRDSGEFTGRDPFTGEVKNQFSPNVDTYWFHHRCYVAKATDKFLLTSRTGVEFVDPSEQDWTINHWVRGGCLYGIMPANGLMYAPPHNCACYPEAKLYGMNALAPSSPARKLPDQIDESGRLEKGPAFGNTQPDQLTISADDWPTFRKDHSRNGFNAKGTVRAGLKQEWTAELGGRLSAPVTAGGLVFVAERDKHSVVALERDSGNIVWRFTTGGRVDSPPTIHRGTAIFGSADGSVYCVRATDGQLVWRFRASPRDERLMAFEGLESVWPVHGSILVKNDKAFFVAGRSFFLDGGLRFFRIDAGSGSMEVEKILDDIDPTTGTELQDRIATLQMPVGLPDVLSTDGKWIYMRSQRFNDDGERMEIGPNSGDAAAHSKVQGGETAHLFSPTGLLDDSYFHRSYWVYGRSFSGGHNGYYQAGKFAPSGRLLVVDDENVYGFGRKPQYYRWTTILEHQLFATGKEAPEVPAGAGGANNAPQAPMIRFGQNAGLNPSGMPVTVEAWVNPDKPNGVVIARGGPQDGFALTLESGIPRFHVRSDTKLATLSAEKKAGREWIHLVGVLDKDASMRFYVDGELAAEGKAPGLLATDPKQGLEVAADDGSAVGEYNSPFGLTGAVDEVRLYLRALTAEEVATSFKDPGAAPPREGLVLAASFDKGNARDSSGRENHGAVIEGDPVRGRAGNGMRFVAARRPKAAGRSAGSFVEHRWTQEIPMIVRALAKAGDTLLVAGPRDIINEEESFQKLTTRDPEIEKLLAEQDAILSQNSEGALLWGVNAKDGDRVVEIKLTAPPVWDGLAVAGNQLIAVTEDGAVTCYASGSP